ncbi:efflux RND transporter periplasmic adaptor subunit [Mesobacterium sp. TK19101]|uniref:Efflux RND transporter periplasmic adaptor subunit n=1 Tax=Mesobacterium hydrothermale TaxID=3111907 RepID=A0ABU6HKE2_9RHOB|nr:efflux RND transporter periplasmic adaptor subunit [Mesobacterium sp. TK19101]MEC3862811.1 efflux RND transporter periplasmic adaptor subunit [Mesobacterium sp. TK19101]
MSCLIEPDQVIRVSTPVAGIVAEVLVDRGDRVSQGQVIARLDTALEEIEVEIAQVRAEDDTEIAALQARIEFLASQAERNEKLARSNAVSQNTAREARLEADLALRELDQARLAKQLAALELAGAKARLDQKVVRSPVDGVVVERLLNPGEYRDGQAHIATVAKMDVLRVEAFVPITYYRDLGIGQPVSILPEPPLDAFRPATIAVIDQVFDAATATVGVRMALPNPDLSLPAGLRCELYFDAALSAESR